MTAEPANPGAGSIRYLGTVTAIGLVAVAFATYVLPKRPGVIVGGLALILVVGAGSQFLFHVATKVSMAWEGRRRTQLQTLVSLVVPVAITLFLASRVDEVSLATLWTMLTRWRRSQPQSLTPKMLATIEQQAAEINSFTSRLDAAYKELESTNARLKEAAFTDEVTGLYNRRFFSSRLEEEVSRYRRLNHPVAVVLLDLDGFNAAKDEYGRAVSEDTLRETAQILMKHTRGINVLSRFDADLFAVLLVETSNEGARVYANRIREAVAVYPFSHGKVMKASFGIASLPGSEEATAGALFQAADEALFAAKRSKEPRAPSDE